MQIADRSGLCSTSRFAKAHAKVASDCTSYVGSFGIADCAADNSSACLLRLSFEYAHIVWLRPCGVKECIWRVAASAKPSKSFACRTLRVANAHNRLQSSCGLKSCGTSHARWASEASSEPWTSDVFTVSLVADAACW